MIQSNKLVRIIFGWAIVAFTVSTVVLALQHVQLNAEIKDAREKLDFMESQLEGELKPRSRRSVAADEEVIEL